MQLAWIYPILLVLLPLLWLGAYLVSLLSIMSLRLHTHALAIATFAAAEILHTILRNEIWLTQGQFGITLVPQFGKGTWIPAYYYPFFGFLLAVGICLIGVLLVRKVTSGGFGRLLRATRDDEISAQALGKNVFTVKIQAFILSGMIAGIAGSIWTHVLGIVHVEQFLPIVTFQIWLAVLLGGRGNHWGVLWGTFLLIVWREGTRFLDTDFVTLISPMMDSPEFLPSLRFIFIGVMLITVVRFLPFGLLPERNTPAIPRCCEAFSRRLSCDCAKCPCCVGCQRRYKEVWTVLCLEQGFIYRTNCNHYWAYRNKWRRKINHV